jgi:hypothetical protein
MRQMASLQPPLILSGLFFRSLRMNLRMKITLSPLSFLPNHVSLVMAAFPKVRRSWMIMDIDGVDFPLLFLFFLVLPFWLPIIFV